MRPMIALLLVCGLLAVPRLARGEVATPTAHDKVEREKSGPASDGGGVDIGVLGGIGFPRPFAIEAVVGLNKTTMFGLEYGFLPKTTISSVNVRLWSVAGDFRVFPFRGAFFLGVRGGYQSISGDTTLSAQNLGSYTESVEVGSWFVNPRLGFLWVWKPIALGIDAGLQIPISTTVSRSSLLAAASPETDAQITSATNTFGKTVLPTIDLIRLGVVF